MTLYTPKELAKIRVLLQLHKLQLPQEILMYLTYNGIAK